MSKSFFTLVFSSLLLLQTTIYAEDTVIEDILPSEEVIEPQEIEQSVAEIKDVEEISEAQKEADEAEAAELRESQVEEEPILD